MRPFFTTLLVLFLLTFTASDLLADKYPKGNSGRSFKPCPVNARMGKRAAVRKTQIRHYKAKHTGVHSYTVSSTPTRSAAPAASGGAADDESTSTAPTTTTTTEPAPAPAPAPTTTTAPVPVDDNTTDDDKVNVDQAIPEGDTATYRAVSINTAPVQAVPISRQTVTPVRVNTSVNHTTTTTTHAQTTSKPNTSTNGTTNTTNTAHPTNVNRVNVNQQSGGRAVQAPTAAPNTTVNTNVDVNVNYINLSNIQVIHN